MVPGISTGGGFLFGGCGLGVCAGREQSKGEQSGQVLFCRCQHQLAVLMPSGGIHHEAEAVQVAFASLILTVTVQ